MALELASSSGTGQNLLTEVALGTYTSTRDMKLSATLELSNLASTGETMTVGFIRMSSDDVEYNPNGRVSWPKHGSTDTRFAADFSPTFVPSGEKVKVTALTSNANGSTLATYKVRLQDAESVNVDLIEGTDASTQIQAACDAAVIANIGLAGASLTAIPWSAAWDAEVESECNDALVALNLDHLMKTACASSDDLTAEVSDDTVLSHLMTKAADTSAFASTSMSLQGISESGGSTGNIASTDITAIKAKTDLIGTGVLTYTSPVAADSKVTVRRGDDYEAGGAGELEWSTTDAANWLGGTLTGSSALFRANHKVTGANIEISGTPSTASGTATVTVALPSSITDDFIENGAMYEYGIRLKSSTGAYQTIVESDVIVENNIFASTA